MFAYNRECKTKAGEFLTPLTAEGDFILCATRKGDTVFKKITDFDNNQKKEKNTVMAIPRKKEFKPNPVPVINIKKEIIPVMELKEVLAKVEPKKEVKKAKTEQDTQKITKQKKEKQEAIKPISKDTYEGYI